MTPKSITFFCLLFLLGFPTLTHAQFGFSHEIGAIAGPVAFQSDFGQRHNLDTNTGNTGIGIGLIHYLNFSYTAECNCYTPETYFNDHFKLRSELSYNKTELQHFGEWIQKINKPAVKLLKGMRATTAVTNIGMQLEYFPFSIREFTSTIGKFAPFVSLGGQFSFYNAKNYSKLGSLKVPENVFPKYFLPSDGRPHGFSTETGYVWSVVGSVGTRYKLSPLQDLMVDLRVQYFYSDWVDGLNPNKDLFHENRANDYLGWLNVGYIYYIQ